MHVQYQVETVISTPGHHAIHTLEAILIVGQPHVIFISEELVVERQADGIGSGRCNKLNVLTGDIVVLEGLPERGGLIGTH